MWRMQGFEHHLSPVDFITSSINLTNTCVNHQRKSGRRRLDLGVCLRDKLVALAHQRLSERDKVFDDAVVHESKPASRSHANSNFCSCYPESELR